MSTKGISQLYILLLKSFNCLTYYKKLLCPCNFVQNIILKIPLASWRYCKHYIWNQQKLYLSLIYKRNHSDKKTNSSQTLFYIFFLFTENRAASFTNMHTFAWPSSSVHDQSHRTQWLVLIAARRAGVSRTSDNRPDLTKSWWIIFHLLTGVVDENILWMKTFSTISQVYTFTFDISCFMFFFTKAKIRNN